jgi:hypothetical protein
MRLMEKRIPLHLLVACQLVAMLASLAGGADLRITVGDRLICRTAACEPAIIQVSADYGEPIGMPMAGPCTSCGTAGCDFGCVTPCNRWARFDYLLWWRRGGHLPSLATSSPDGTALNQAGVLGSSSTTVLFGSDTYGQDAAPGGRITVGTWLGDDGSSILEGRFFALGRETVNFNANSNGSPILARPFNNQDALIGPVGPTSRPLAFPGIANNGSVFVRSESEVYGSDLVLRWCGANTGTTRIDLMLGYHFSRITENLTIGDSFIDIDPVNLIADGTRQDILDRFDTRNEFHGGVIGLEAAYHGDCWRLDLLARVALGNMRQIVNVSGQTTNDVPGDPGSPFVLAEGLLAGTANQGRRERDKFAVVPEFGATLVFELSECVDLSFGYSYIYWSNVVQAGQQIDPLLFVPSQFAFNDNSYWVHGLNVGAEFRF